MKNRKTIPFMIMTTFLLPLIGCSSGPKMATVTFDPNNGEATFSVQVKIGDLLEEPEETPSKTAYSFRRWAKGSLKWSFRSYKVEGDMTLVADYDPLTYTVTYDLNNGSEQYDENHKLNPREYNIEDNISLIDPILVNYNFLGWFDDNGKKISILGDGLYGDLNLHAEYGFDYENNITFGKYPQHFVTDPELNEQLKNINQFNEEGYIELDGKEYLQVISDKTFSYSLYSQNYQINAGDKIFFIVEPIVWDIYGYEGDDVILFSRYIINSMPYNSNYGTGVGSIDHRYEFSTIREYLNDEFMNKYFTSEEKSFIKLHHTDNSKETVKDYPGNMNLGYVVYSNDTDDYFYLPSVVDIVENVNYKTNDDKKARRTNYCYAAEYNGVVSLLNGSNGYDFASYGTRSPSYYNNRNSDINSYGEVSWNQINEKTGLRPMVMVDKSFLGGK